MSPDPTAPLGPDADAVAGQTFSRSRKGFEPDEVRAYLVGLASQLRESHRSQADMARRLAELERRSTDPRELDVAQVSELLGEETARVLDTARKAAVEIRTKAEKYAAETRDAAAEYDTTTRSDADEYAHVARHAAQDDADVTRSAAAQESVRVRAEAERVLVERTGEAETAAAATRAEADAYGEHARAEADAYADTTRAAAESYRADEQQAADAYREQTRAEADAYSESTRAAADAYRAEQHRAGDAYRAEATADGEQARAAVEAEVAEARAAADAALAEGRVALQAEADGIREVARRQGRSMVDEARDYRDRVIADLADRRRAARAQLEQLTTSRDALAVTLTDVAERIEASHRALSSAELSTQGLGDVAGDRAALPERPLAEELQDPWPGQSSEADANADAEDHQGDDSNVDDAQDHEGDDANSESVGVPDVAGVAPDVANEETAPESVEESGAAVSESEVPLDAADVEEVAAEEVAAVVGSETVAGDTTPIDDPEATEDVDRAAALFAQLKAATKASTSVSELEALVGEIATTTSEDGTASQPEVNGRAAAGDVEPSDSGAPPAGDQAPTAEEGHTSGSSGSVQPPELERPDEPEAETATGPTDEPPGETDQSAGPSDEPVLDDSDVDLLDRRDAATDELERQLARRLKRVLSDEQNEALDRMRRVKGAPQVEQVLVSEDEHRERYRAAAAEYLTAAERAGAGFFGEAPAEPAPIDDIAEAFASDLVQALRGRLEGAFHDGGDEQEIGDRIRACYREWKTQRIADVARHYVQVAFGRGVAAFESDTPTRWLVDHAGVPAPDCDDNALAGAVEPGQPFPTGDLHPPIHSGCRCLAVPAAT